MERAEKIGLGIASAAHVLLFAALSTNWVTPKPISLENKPIEVSIADAVDLQSMAPKLSETPPPPSPGEEEGPPEQAAPAPSESIAQPQPAPAPPPPAPAPKPKPVEKPEPKPVPKPEPKPTPKPTPKPPEPAKPKPAATPAPKAPAKPVSKPAPPAKPAAKAPAKPEAKPSTAKTASASATDKGTGDKGTAAKSSGSKLKLDTSDWMKSASRSTTPATKPSEGAPASAISAAQTSALNAEIRRQVKPHWKAPTGADVESLRTIVSVKLARDGSVIGTPQIVDTQGVTDSNRTQVRLHQEQAIKAVRLAAPFQLPAQFYSTWQSLQINFDKRLSQ